MSDQYLWLEDVQAEKSLDWVKKENETSIHQFRSWEQFEAVSNKICQSLESKEKIPFVHFIEEDFVYNLWTDENHRQGLFQRATILEYDKPDCQWDVLIDFDLESKRDSEKWVYHSFNISPNKKTAMVAMSPGGTDADVIREFCLETKTFISNGFNLALSKGQVSWLSQDELLVMRDFGEETLTSCGYPRTMRLWKRGSLLQDSKIIFDIPKEESFLFTTVEYLIKNTRVLAHRLKDFYTQEIYEYTDQSFQPMNLPEKFESLGMSEESYFISLEQNWTNGDQSFQTGDVLVYDFSTKKSSLVYRPPEKVTVYQGGLAARGLYLIIDRDVKSELIFLKRTKENWTIEKVDLPQNGSLEYLVTSPKSDHYYVGYDSFNCPLTYFHGSLETPPNSIKTQASFFDHKNLDVQQYFAMSLDGTQIPYFVVHKIGLKYDKTNPTILYGYGGFNISIKPHFNDALGIAWLDQGGVYVLANIRGGGEYGPNWHQCALKHNRERTYQDFFSVAEELIAKKITSPQHLGAKGRSNGGLLMGVCYTKRPDLFAAIDCGVPLLDMRRYHKLLAGHSWIAEYGNPDDEVDGEYIRNLSPYHRIEAKELNYPVMYLNTSTKDDRVHPAHARKFAAKLKELNFPFYYYENIEGGHAGAANTLELANNQTFSYAFFWKHLR